VEGDGMGKYRSPVIYSIVLYRSTIVQYQGGGPVFTVFPVFLFFFRLVGLWGLSERDGEIQAR